MNCGFLCPLKNQRLALFFPTHDFNYQPSIGPLGVAHTATEQEKEGPLILFSPRPVPEEKLREGFDNLIHDVQFRSIARQYMGEAIFRPATQLLLGQFHHILQVFGAGDLAIMLFVYHRYSAESLVVGTYWLFLLPFFIAVARALVAAHGKETMAGLRRLYHSPLGYEVIVHPALAKLAEIVEAQGYKEALRQIRNLGLPELTHFYRRATQYGRWNYGEGPNPCGVIECPQ